MPWKETCPMEERMKFVVYYLEQEYSMSALCRGFGISRKTGYKIIHHILPSNTFQNRILSTKNSIVSDLN